MAKSYLIIGRLIEVYLSWSNAIWLYV